MSICTGIGSKALLNLLVFIQALIPDTSLINAELIFPLDQAPVTFPIQQDLILSNLKWKIYKQSK